MVAFTNAVKKPAGHIGSLKDARRAVVNEKNLQKPSKDIVLITRETL